jgi:hypothetical protein
MWATVIREHYILFIENLEPNAQVIKGTTVVTPSALTVVINMATQAFSMFTNLPLRGATETPSDTGKNVLYIINDEAGGNICSGDALFDEIGKDTLVGDSGTSATIYDYGQTSTVSTVYGTATAFNVTGDKKYVSQITITADCNLESIRAYMKGQGGGSATTNVKAVLYTDSSGSPDALLQESSVAVVTQADQDQFVNFSFSSLPAVAAGTYWIGIHVETSGRAMAYKFSTANLTKYNSDTYVGGAANPFGAASNDTGPLVIFARVKTAGPDFYIESKKYTQDDAMRKKLFKQLAINYLVQGDSLRLDTVPGLNDLGRTSSSTFPTSVFTWTSLTSSVATWAALSALYSNWEQLINSVYRPKRIKFLKRTQMLSFRIWANSPSVTAAQLGPFQIGYKLQRAGRI